MKQQWRVMTYDREIDRWIVDSEGRCYSLHCGEGFNLSIGSMSIPCRIEYDSQWYIIMPGARFYLRTGSSYKVEI